MKGKVRIIKKVGLLLLLLVISFALSVINKIKGSKGVQANKAEACWWSGSSCDGHTCDSADCGDCSY